MEWVDSPLGAFGHVSMPRAPSPEKQRACFCSLNRSGQTYTDAGFKAIWNRPQVEFKSRGGERFHFHDLRDKYVTDKEERGEDSSQGTGHKNRATVERTYDRRRIRKATPAQ